MDVKGDRAILRFKNVGQGLVAKDGPLKGFAVAGEDRKFVNAEAEIEGDTVVVRSDQVEQPVAVRFGWANYPARQPLEQGGPARHAVPDRRLPDDHRPQGGRRQVTPPAEPGRHRSSIERPGLGFFQYPIGRNSPFALPAGRW